MRFVCCDKLCHFFMVINTRNNSQTNNIGFLLILDYSIFDVELEKL